MTKTFAKKLFITLTTTFGTWVSADVINDGSLSLSGPGNTFDYIDQDYSTADDLIITFSFSTWGSAYMSDGFALTLFDADTLTPEIGGTGGSLGYANRSGADGLAGGVLGIGFDAHGNFSAATEGRNGGLTTKVSSSVSLRGSMGSTRQDGYEYIAGTGSLADFMNNNRADSQAEAAVRNVRVTITSDERISVEWKLENELDWTTLIDEVDASEQMQLTDEVKVGITSSMKDKMNVQIDSIAVIPEPAMISLCLVFGGGILATRRIFSN